MGQDADTVADFGVTELARVCSLQGQTGSEATAVVPLFLWWKKTRACTDPEF